MFKASLTLDAATGEPVPVYRAWVGDTVDGYRVVDSITGAIALPGVWTRDTAEEIARHLNHNKQFTEELTNDASDTH